MCLADLDLKLGAVLFIITVFGVFSARAPQQQALYESGFPVVNVPELSAFPAPAAPTLAPLAQTIPQESNQSQHQPGLHPSQALRAQ
eukprot:m.236966 g.236966  ORF g.236966 m.236966 type:complete len:87 (+) comp20867_c0_seq1:55-315(+)